MVLPNGGVRESSAPVCVCVCVCFVSVMWVCGLVYVCVCVGWRCVYLSVPDSGVCGSP